MPLANSRPTSVALQRPVMRDSECLTPTHAVHPPVWPDLSCSLMTCIA